jgi:hypothetical protein
MSKGSGQVKSFQKSLALSLNLLELNTIDKQFLATEFCSSNRVKN